MICPFCKGTGMVNLSHFPRSSGGWMDEDYIFSGIKSGACNWSDTFEDTPPLNNE